MDLDACLDSVWDEFSCVSGVASSLVSLSWAVLELSAVASADRRRRRPPRRLRRPGREALSLVGSDDCSGSGLAVSVASEVMFLSLGWGRVSVALRPLSERRLRRSRPPAVSSTWCFATFWVGTSGSAVSSWVLGCSNRFCHSHFRKLKPISAEGFDGVGAGLTGLMVLTMGSSPLIRCSVWGLSSSCSWW